VDGATAQPGQTIVSHLVAHAGGRAAIAVGCGSSKHAATSLAVALTMASIHPHVGRRGEGSLEDDVAAAVHDANRAIFAFATIGARVRRWALTDPDYRGICASLTALFVDGEHAAIAHLGKTAAFRVRAGEVERLSADHTLAAAIEARGAVAEEPSFAHILVRAAGLAEEVEVPVWKERIAPGDVFVLASDAAVAALDRDALLRVVAEPPARAAENLATALAAGVPMVSGSIAVLRVFAAASPAR
jgi:protein phosphatase